MVRRPFKKDSRLDSRCSSVGSIRVLLVRSSERILIVPYLCENKRSPASVRSKCHYYKKSLTLLNKCIFQVKVNVITIDQVRILSVRSGLICKEILLYFNCLKELT